MTKAIRKWSCFAQRSNTFSAPISLLHFLCLHGHCGALSKIVLWRNHRNLLYLRDHTSYLSLVRHIWRHYHSTQNEQGNQWCIMSRHGICKQFTLHQEDSCIFVWNTAFSSLIQGNSSSTVMLSFCKGICFPKQSSCKMQTLFLSVSAVSFNRFLNFTT